LYTVPPSIAQESSERRGERRIDRQKHDASLPKADVSRPGGEKRAGIKSADTSSRSKANCGLGLGTGMTGSNVGMFEKVDCPAPGPQTKE